MNITEKVLMPLLWERTPELDFTEVEERVKEFRQRLLDVDSLMIKWEETKMRKLLSSLNHFVEDVKSTKGEFEKNALVGFGGCIGALVGLFTIANPVGRLLVLGGGLLMAVGGLGRADDINDDKKGAVYRIQKAIEDDGANFQGMDIVIRRLDNVCQRYLNCSLLSKECKQFLESAVRNSVTDTEKMHLLLEKIQTAQVVNKVHSILNTHSDK